ncbi:GTPase-activating protein GYP7 Ecym_6462 [Eremothecium cymbalariae DBVPG|uniref:Rab-GAP TBC domain-containing protein n=1 Tax=Eremothecium cymbalariae (strain CBS 270.75 / DBVPG 7215 / KCTC 17166 / NRRL Y-17582) TaxID=931890 RepID=G8JUQ3_ERECY|nr:hypothetical protein Ecym_6462 [Eremothecium cymbalariae DBVPG\
MSTNLLFCKSEVFALAHQNSNERKKGILLITRDPQQPVEDSTVTWVDTEELSNHHLAFLQSAELKLSISPGASLQLTKDVVLQAMYSPLSFSLKLSYIISLKFIPPDPNGWYQGSVTIKSKNDIDDIPILFFNDSACPSTKDKAKQLINSFQPFETASNVYWGGADFRDLICLLVDMRPTKNDSSVYLINATPEELLTFSMQTPKVVSSLRSGMGEGSETNVWNSFQNYRWSAMSMVASATTKVSTLVGTMVRKHPLVQLAERNSNNPYVRKMLDNPRVQDVQREFDSAKIYLAKWSLGVKEQAEKYRLNDTANDNYRRILVNEFGTEGDFEVTEKMLDDALKKRHPVTEDEWLSFFDQRGRLFMSEREIKSRIFHGGVESMSLRRQVWPFLLGVYSWGSSYEERVSVMKELHVSYQKYKTLALERTPLENEAETAYWSDQIFRIEKDVKRNDRNLDLFRYNTKTGAPPNKAGTSKDSPDKNSSDDKEEADGNWEIKNPHLKILRDILICYNLYNSRLGYVQGMTDLLSPLYCVLQDEEMTFWCFVKFMDRMERNFLRDQSGIRDQMLTISELCQLLLPKFNEHLGNCDSSNFFFCFRMLLVWFKREFEFEGICNIWEIFWTNFYSSQFQIFFLLAIFQKNSRPVMYHLTQFDEVLKYFNELKGAMNWNDLMVRAELLFIHFKKTVAVFDRDAELHHRSSAGTTGYQKNITAKEKKEFTKNVISENLRLLLSTKLIVQIEETKTGNSLR